MPRLRSMNDPQPVEPGIVDEALEQQVQWSEPSACGQMNASSTRRMAAGDAST